MLKSSIRRQLLVTFTSITAVGGLILFFVAGRLLQNATITFYQRDILTETVTLAGTLSGGDGDGDNSILSNPLGQYALRRLSSEPDWQFYIINREKHLIPNKSNSQDPVDQSAIDNAPEIATALSGTEAQNIRTDESGNVDLYSAAPVLFRNKNVQAVLWLVVPMQPAYDQVNHRWLEMAAVLLPIIVLIVVASLWVARTLTLPIQQLNQAVLRITAGHRNERIVLNRDDELGQLARSFNEMLDSLETLIHAQRSFVSNAAHELRTPLMSMKLRVEALMDETVAAEERQNYLIEASDEIQHMAELVTALLTLARLDEGKHTSSVESFDVAALLHDSARSSRIRAAQLGIKIESEIPDSLPDVAISIADMRIVLDNLLTNAMKYTHSGGCIWIRARVVDSQLCVEVSDTGEGFDPEIVPHLFERFYRANLDRNKLIAGHGLGLAIVDALLKQNGGSIKAVSKGQGQGAAFTLYIPLAAG